MCSVLSMRIRFGSQNFSKFTCSEQKMHTLRRPHPLIKLKVPNVVTDDNCFKFMRNAQNSLKSVMQTSCFGCGQSPSS